MGADLGAKRRRDADARRGQAVVLDPAAAAERDGRAAHGARLQPQHHGCADASAPHARLQHAVAAGHRSRRHRHADRGRAPVAGAGPVAPRRRPRGVHQARLGLEGNVGQRHHRPDAAHRRHGGLVARVLHDGRDAVGRRQRDFRAPVRRGPDLSRQAPGQLGSGADVGSVGPRSRERGGRRLSLAHPLPARRRLGLAGGGDDAAGDDARRHRGDGASRRRTLRGVDRQARHAAAVRSHDPGHRRRLRRSRVRHRRRQGHAGARPQRLRRRPAPRPADDRRADGGREGQ